MSWTSRQQLTAQVQRLWDNGRLLASRLHSEPVFPLRLRLKTPIQRALSDQFAEVRAWIDDLHKIQHLRIQYKTIRHRVLGQNDIPDSAWLDHLEDACKLLHKLPDLARFDQIIHTTRERHPQLLTWIEQHPLQALVHANDWERLLDLIDWLQQHPRPNIYLRQVDLPNIDSKFIEQHRKLLIALLDLSLPAQSVDARYSGVRQFARRYGFRDKPAMQRLRLLDPALRLVSGNEQDFSLTQGGFRALNESGWIDEHIQRIFITENEINYLAFPTCPDSLLLFGAGYGFENFSDIDWLNRLPIIYWGDIDTHGFAILDQLRAILPQTQSLLMDQATLLAHQQFWGREDKPQRRELTRLSDEENALYQDLINNRWGQQLRLEQERIGYPYLNSALQKRAGAVEPSRPTNQI